MHAAKNKFSKDLARVHVTVASRVRAPIYLVPASYRYLYLVQYRYIQVVSPSSFGHVVVRQLRDDVRAILVAYKYLVQYSYSTGTSTGTVRGTRTVLVQAGTVSCSCSGLCTMQGGDRGGGRGVLVQTAVRIHSNSFPFVFFQNRNPPSCRVRA